MIINFLHCSVFSVHRYMPSQVHNASHMSLRCSTTGHRALVMRVIDTPTPDPTARPTGKVHCVTACSNVVADCDLCCEGTKSFRKYRDGKYHPTFVNYRAFSVPCTLHRAPGRRRRVRLGLPLVHAVAAAAARRPPLSASTCSGRPAASAAAAGSP